MGKDIHINKKIKLYSSKRQQYASVHFPTWSDDHATL